MADLIRYNGDSKVIKRICELLNTMSGVNFVVVQTLPTTDISTNTIYLVPKQEVGTDNIYDEYINTDGTSQGWELIGTTEIDLSNYYTKTETDDLLDDKADIGDIPTDFVPKSTGGVFEGNVEIVTANSGTSNVNSRFRLGNNKAVGTVGNTRGVIQIFDQNGNYTNIFASDNESSGNIYLPKDKPNNSVLAITDDIPDELSDLQDDSTHRLVTDTEKTTWNGKSDTDENVKQVYTQTTSGDYLLLASNSNKDSTSDETEKVKKIAHAYITGSTGNVVFCRKHTYTSVQNHILAIGNAIIDGVEGAVDGVLRLFGKGAYYSQFYDGFNSLTSNQTYRPRDLTGTMALLPDIADSCIQVENGEYNFINPPYYHASGTHSSGITYSTNENTGEYTVKGTASSAFNANIKRWSQGLYLKTGKYKLSGLPSNTGCQLRVYSSTSSGTTTLIGSDTGSGFEFSLTERTLMHIVLVIPTNTVVDFTFRPKLGKLSEWVELGSISSTATNFATNNYKELKAVFEISYTSYKKYVTVFIDYAKIGGSEAYFSNGFDVSGEVSVVAKLILGTPNFSVRTSAILPTGMSMPSATLYAKA